MKSCSRNFKIRFRNHESCHVSFEGLFRSEASKASGATNVKFSIFSNVSNFFEFYNIFRIFRIFQIFSTFSIFSNFSTLGSAHVHRFDSRFHNNAGVVRVSRPRIVQTGAFAVQAFPHQTPVVVGGAGATPVITAARNNEVSNLFQTPDGRVFAFSNGNQRILPGQIFQTPDGQFFTTSVQQNEPESEEENNEASIVASREQEPEEEQEEVTEIEPQNNQRNQQQQQRSQQQEVVVSQSNIGLTSFAAVPQVLARAPLTPATSRFVATPQVAIATPQVAAPIALGTPGVTRFFHFPGAGFALDF